MNLLELFIPEDDEEILWPIDKATLIRHTQTHALQGVRRSRAFACGNFAFYLH